MMIVIVIVIVIIIYTTVHKTYTLPYIYVYSVTLHYVVE